MAGFVTRWLAGSATALRTALAEPRLKRVQLAWIGSTSGEFLSTVAFGLFAYAVGGATAVGIVALVQMVPAMLISPFAGVLGDRLRRELVVIGTDLVRAAAMALAAIAAAADAPAATVYLLAAVVTIVSQAFYPAQMALVPLLARSADDVTAASAASSLIRNGASLLAPALSGLVLLVADVSVLFALAAVAFGLAALILLGVGRTDSVRSAPPVSGRLQELASGFRMAAQDRAIALVIGLFAVHGIARGSMGVLLVVVPIELLGTSEAGVGFISAVLGFGGLVGAVATAGLVGRRTIAASMTRALTVTGGALLLAGAVPATAIVILCVSAVGVGFAVVSVVGSTLLVRSTRDDVLARVIGVLGSVRSGSMALGSILAAALVAVGGAQLALVVTGIVLVAAAAVARLGVRMLDARSEVPEDELRLLRAAPVFAPILPVALERLAARLEPIVVPSGTEIVRQGDPGDCVYLVAEGEFAVETDGRVLSHLGPCDLVGEMALLRNAPRNATVRAVQASRVYRLERSEFLAAVTGHPVSTREATDLISTRLELRRRTLDEG